MWWLGVEISCRVHKITYFTYFAIFRENNIFCYFRQNPTYFGNFQIILLKITKREWERREWLIEKESECEREKMKQWKNSLDLHLKNMYCSIAIQFIFLWLLRPLRWIQSKEMSSFAKLTIAKQKTYEISNCIESLKKKMSEFQSAAVVSGYKLKIRKNKHRIWLALLAGYHKHSFHNSFIHS